MEKKSKSVSTFRVRQSSSSALKKEQIVIEFKGSSPRRKVASIPGSIEK
jgi:hypothetical protein